MVPYYIVQAFPNSINMVSRIVKKQSELYSLNDLLLTMYYNYVGER